MAVDLLSDHSHFVVGEVQFVFYSSDEIRKLSAKEILNPETFNDAQQSNIGGLYDPALGPLDPNEQCSTCSLSRVYCPGHMGHIELPVPVYHTLFFERIYKLLKASCLECHRVCVDKGAEQLFVCQSKLLKRGRYTAFGQLEDLYNCSKNQSSEELMDTINEFTENALKDDSSWYKDSLTRNKKELHNTLLKTFVQKFEQTKNKCSHCNHYKKTIRRDHKAKIVVVASTSIIKNKKNEKATKKNSNTEMISQKEGNQEEENSDDDNRGSNITVSADVILLTQSKVKEILRLLWINHSEMLMGLYPFLAESTLEYPTDIFFLDALGVPANRYRPISESNGMKFEHPQTANLHKVLTSCITVREIMKEMGNLENFEKLSQKSGKKKSVLAELGEAMERLQRDVNLVVDKTSDATAKDSQPGIRQLLESKEGLFRKNIMGKRVNHACRSVISPDPNIATNEIGIPEVFAKNLTFPQPVTPWNVHELRQAVINGPNVHPGAVCVTNEDCSEVLLDKVNKTRREAIANQLLTPSTTSSRNAVFGTKTVHRHLKNGDMLLLNRQPTLHRPSIQGHMARVLKGEKTMRLNYMNCKAYNADFDGDEMSAHFPQSELCRSEAYNIASTDFQYLGPKDGTPLAGLMQDHIVSGVHLSIRGKFFCKEDYCNLVNSAVFDKHGPIKTLPPTILRPYRSYTGKQVISSVILNVLPENAVKLSFDGKAKVPEKSWIKASASRPAPPHMGESDVVIRQGELLVGIFDKQHLGATSYGLIHCVNELYGGRVAGRLLTCLGRLFLCFLKMRGFTLGVEDIIVKGQDDKKRRKIIKKSLKVGDIAAKKALELGDNVNDRELRKSLQKAHFDQDERQMRELDLSMRGQTNDIQNSIVNTIMPHGLIKQFPGNNLQLMVKSGSKGSMVNTMQISCLLGQIELEGKRPPLMLSGKTLPSFTAYDVSPRAGGFVSDRFLTGVRPQEYFFHCMAGREGLVDTAVKTSRSGYLQRCIIKHLEGIKVHYDSTVRDSDNSVIQFQYGEDGLDVNKAVFLNDKQLPMIAENSGAINKCDIVTGDDFEKVKKAQKKIDKWKKTNKKSKGTRQSGFLEFCKMMESPESELRLPGRTSVSAALCDSWRKLLHKQREKLNKYRKSPDPILTQFLPHQRGVFPEKLYDLLKTYAVKHYKKDDAKMTVDEFMELMDVKVKQSLAEPGEAVGLVCAQSIGEPSTQMTLNTFHFAGRGEMNMTLGIPRLREILMTGSKMIKTPAIDVPVMEGTKARTKVKALQKWLNKVYLSEVLEGAEVVTWLSLKGRRTRLFKVTFTLLPRECYKQRFSVTPEYILRHMEKKFFKSLVTAIKAQMSKLVETREVRSKKQSDKTAAENPNNEYIEDDFQSESVPFHNKDNDDDDDDDDDDDISDNDMAADDRDEYSQRLNKKRVDEREYEDEEKLNEEGVAVEEKDVESGMVDNDFDEEELEKEDDLDDLEEGDLEETLIRMVEMKVVKKDKEEIRINNVLQAASEVVGYSYDKKKHMWCELTLSFPIQDNQLDISDIIRKLAEKTVIHQVPGISKCFLGEQQGEQGTELRLKTEGINIEEMCKHSLVLDLNRMYCNNIYTVETTYGIEAARNVIIKEMQSVFGAYGIEVNYRHLSLLADYMTFEGSYKAFSRRTMASNASPFQRMSYETSLTFLVDACINAEVDDLSSPSAQITMGKNITCGTGLFDINIPLKL